LKISIITVCYNSAGTLQDTLASVREQSYPQIEHIVVDGASTDGSVDVIRNKGSRVTTFVSEPDRGIYDAMNKGIQLATGDVVGFLNSDDVFANDDVVSRIAQTMRDPSIDACYGDLVYVSQEDTNKVVRYWKSRKYKHGLFNRGWVPAHPTFYARRDVYLKYGGFDLGMRLAADFDILLRFFVAHKITSAYIPEVLVRMRLGGATNGSLGNVLRQNREISRAFHKYSLDVGLKPFAFKLISRVSQFVRKPSSNE
jgi:glycosyltransferase involved in cell wall biosynthesis